MRVGNDTGPPVLSTPEPLGWAQPVNVQHLTTVLQPALGAQRVRFPGMLWTQRLADFFTGAHRSHQGLLASPNL